MRGGGGGFWRSPLRRLLSPPVIVLCVLDDFLWHSCVSWEIAKGGERGGRGGGGGGGEALTRQQLVEPPRNRPVRS